MPQSLEGVRTGVPGIACGIRRFAPGWPPGLGRAFWLALALVGAVEFALHQDAVVHTWRSVFAVGRALDKVLFVEAQPPQVLFVGNSRTDNAIDPRTALSATQTGFNLGLPGANTLAYQGVLARLDARGKLGPQAISTVVFGLDENAFQPDDSLGYLSFFADRQALRDAGLWRVWLGSGLRLWSYSANLRQLREPDKALRFVAAALRPVEPVGGAAREFLGYRAGFGAAQNQAQVVQQESTALVPPHPLNQAFFWKTLDTLHARGVRVVAVIPPLRDRPSAFVSRAAWAAPYRAILDRLRARGVRVVLPALDLAPDEFVNGGHLNDRGAQRYSAALRAALATE